MMGDIFYIPIMCCGKEMDEIYQDGKRICATCSECGKTWRPKISNNPQWTITKMYVKNTDTNIKLLKGE
jgi:uncharacterized Zn finger protein